MIEQTIEVTIEPDGNVQIHIQGIKGTACLAETEALLALLGGKVLEQGFTIEMYEDAQQEQYNQEKYHA
jgi:acetyl-CoA carboxylase beta subunit